MNQRIIPIAIALALLATPVVAAGWAGKGSYEPDTAADFNDGYMWKEADQAKDGVRRVYFNGYQAMPGSLVAVTSTNPNLGNPLVQSGILTPVNFNAQALLGIWKDCNKDGYIGLGDNAAFEYRAEILTLPGGAGTSVCSVESLPPLPRPRGDHRPVLAHNDGKWVREFIPLGPENTQTTATDQNPFNIPDSGARVWADWGEPGAPPGFICWLSSHPRGSWHSTGGIVNLVDCYSRGRINNTLGSSPVLQTAYDLVKGRDCDDAVVSNYQDHVGCNPWGESDKPALVDVGDCSTPLATQRVQGKDVRVPRPGVPTTTTSGSIAGTVFQLDNDVSDCDPQDDSEWNVDKLPYQTEADILNQNGGRIMNDWVLKYVEEVRPGGASALTGTLGYGTTRDLGTKAVPEGIWRANSVSTYGHNSVVSIDSLGPQQVRYLTYYAYVSPRAVSDFSLVLPGTTGTYGTEACGAAIGAGQPDQNSWKCDPANWWPQTDAEKNVIGGGYVDGFEVFVGRYVGESYNVRDIDCYDTSIEPLRAEGIHYGVATGSSCV